MFGTIAASLLAAQTLPAYHIDSRAIAEVEVGGHRATEIFFTPDPNILLILARNKEYRWVDLRLPFTKDIVRLGKLTEQPKGTYSAEQLKMIEDGKKWLETVYGTANVPDLEASSVDIAGNKEFCLTDRQDEFFFYSSETGALLRKVKIQGPVYRKPQYDALSLDLKFATVSDNEAHEQYVCSTETGKRVLTVKYQFLDTFCFLADSKRFVHLSGPNMAVYSLSTGKVIQTVKLPYAKTANIVPGPTGSQVAFNIMKPDFNYDGAVVYDIDAKTTVKIDPELKAFGTTKFSPDGKLLLLTTQKRIHIADAVTGKHKMTLEPYFTAMWDSFFSLKVSLAGDRIILCNDPSNINVDLRYSITADLNQKPGEPVKYPLKGPG